jgi:hypothetical protein
MTRSQNRSRLLQAAQKCILSELPLPSCVCIVNSLYSAEYEKWGDLRTQYGEFFDFSQSHTADFDNGEDVRLIRSLCLLLYRETL